MPARGGESCQTSLGCQVDPWLNHNRDEATVFSGHDSDPPLLSGSKRIQMSTKNNACCLPWVKSAAMALQMGTAITLVRDWESFCGARAARRVNSQRVGIRRKTF